MISSHSVGVISLNCFLKNILMLSVENIFGLCSAYQGLLQKGRGGWIHSCIYRNGSCGTLWPCGTLVGTCTGNWVLRLRKGRTPAPQVNFKRVMRKNGSLLSLAAGSWHPSQTPGRSTALSDLPEVTEDTFHRAGNRPYVSWAWASSLHVNIWAIFPLYA